MLLLTLVCVTVCILGLDSEGDNFIPGCLQKTVLCYGREKAATIRFAGMYLHTHLLWHRYRIALKADGPKALHAGHDASRFEFC